MHTYTHTYMHKTEAFTFITQVIDGLNEEAKEAASGKIIGTTRKGIGPCYASKINRNGVRVGDLFESWDGFETKYRYVSGFLDLCNIVYVMKCM